MQTSDNRMTMMERLLAACDRLFRGTKHITDSDAAEAIADVSTAVDGFRATVPPPDFRECPSCKGHNAPERSNCAYCGHTSLRDIYLPHYYVIMRGGVVERLYCVNSGNYIEHFEAVDVEPDDLPDQIEGMSPQLRSFMRANFPDEMKIAEGEDLLRQAREFRRMGDVQ